MRPISTVSRDPFSRVWVLIDFSAVVIAMLAIYALITNPLLLFVMVFPRK